MMTKGKRERLPLSFIILLHIFIKRAFSLSSSIRDEIHGNILHKIEETE